MLVSEIMSTAVEFVSPDANIRDLAVLMGELDVGGLPVGGPRDLQGVITDRDILFRVVAEGRDSVGTRVRDVMSTTVFKCRETDSLSTAMDLMGGLQVRRLPVVDADGGVIGIVTLTDIARYVVADSAAIDALIEGAAATGEPS